MQNPKLAPVLTLLDLENKLGHTFAESALLAQALTHRSFSAHHNERLEFLGDSILNCAIAKLIYDRHSTMPEGELSRLRANLVNQQVLAEIAAELGIGPLLRLGEGEIKTGGDHRPSILADAVEALLGATFLDAGFDSACLMVERLFAPRLNVIDGKTAPSKDAKTALQEWLQARHHSLPQYMVAKIEGEAHKQTFEVHCAVASEGINTIGRGNSRRAAEQDAANKAYQVLLEQKTQKARTTRTALMTQTAQTTTPSKIPPQTPPTALPVKRAKSNSQHTQIKAKSRG